jgi:hypothetical protein
MHTCERACAAAASALAATAAQAVIVTTTFDAGIEGWSATINDNGTTNVWIDSGGNPGGYLQSDDTIDGWGYVSAPAPYLVPGLLPGGAFSFDLRTVQQGFAIGYRVRVGLSGGGLNLINESVLPTADWASYSFALTAGSGWRVVSDLNQNYNAADPAPTEMQFAAALGSLTGLFIAADYSDGNAATNGTLDRAEFDNIVLRTPDATAVPAPASWALVLIGAVGMGWSSRRRS